MGVAYDLFGNGKTALKFNYGKYLSYAANDSPYTSTNPGATIVRSVTNRGWTDGNKNYVVDCNLLNPALQDSLATGGDLCAAASSTAANFGKPGGATIVDPGVLSGWGVRPGDTQYTFTVQQQVIPRVSADFSYTHRVFKGFFVTTDLNKHAGGVLSGSPAGSYETYTLTAPVDARLPGGGGYPVTVYAPTAAANAVAAKPYLVRESDLGAERDSHWDGVEFNVNARFRGGLITQFGTSTGRGVVNTCETIQLYAPTTATNTGSAGPDPRGCNNEEPFQTKIRGLASYTIPKVDVLVSATVRSTANSLVNANWQIPNSVVQSALGHLPPGATATGTTTIALTDNENRLYVGDRRTTVDMRFAKVLRFNRTRTDIGVDLNNMLNTNYPTSYNGTYIYTTDNTPRPGGFLAPTAIYNPRFVRLNFTVNF